MEAAAKLGYQRNREVSKIMSSVRRRQTMPIAEKIAYLSRGDEFPSKGDEMLDSIIRKAAAQRATQQGYRIDFFNRNETGMTVRRLNDILVSRGIRGLIIGPFNKDRDELDLDWPRFATVAVGYSLRKPEPHRVTRDVFHDMLFVLELLQAKGYQRFGLVIDTSRMIRRAQFAEGGLKAYERWHSVTPVEPFLPGKIERAPFLDWYRKNRPDVVIGFEERYASWLQEEGLNIPRDVAFVDFSKTHASNPFYSGFSPNYPLLATTSVDRLAALLRENNFGLPEFSRATTVEGHWHPGSSI